MRTAIVTTALLLVTAAAGGCKKESAPGTATPQAADGAKAGSGLTLRYEAKPAALRQKTHYEVTVSGGGQYGQAKADVMGTVRLEPSGKDKLVVRWQVEQVDGVELTGLFELKAEEGEPPPPDVKKVLLEDGKDLYVTDLRGEPDRDATKAHPEVKKQVEATKDLRKQLEEARKAAGKEEAAKKDPKVQELERKLARRQIVDMFGGAFALPVLPKEALEVGKEITVESQEEVDLPTGTKLPMDVESTYRIVKVDDGGGSRIAEVEVSVEASGAVEFQGGMLVVDQSTDATLLWDLDAALPVSLSNESAQSFSVGEQGQEVSTVLESQYEPVAP